LRLRFLGTGTSFGIPVLGCDCRVCRSDDPRDRRTRHAALLDAGVGRRLLVDTPPELRLQLVDAGVHDIDAVWFTHAHADHVHGIDDLRAFSARLRRPLPAFTDSATADALRERFRYIFDRDYRPPHGTMRPELDLREVDPAADGVDVAGLRLLPLELPHGDMTVLGFRTGPLGYVTDAKRLTGEVSRRLAGVRVLVLNALWFGNPHPTHFNIEEAVEAARAVGAERTFLTHLTHRVSHARLLDSLPAGIAPAYDGLTIDIEEDRP
jgi:phosphoribosyl 1,2-cyclic phosphate phosphodiesterase